MKEKNSWSIVPVMFCFFAMGFVDLVGIASNFVKADMGLNDKTANIFPSLVFFWFLIFSVPTSVLMNRIGRKNTVMLSLLVTLLSLIIPVFGESFWGMAVAFSLLGIGNAIMQTSLNPLVSSFIEGKHLASTLTFGQFIKAIASFLAPYLASWGAAAVIPSMGLGWRVLFAIYFLVGLLATLLLAFTPVPESKSDSGTTGNAHPLGIGRQFADCFKLLGTPIILLCFIAIMCHVGIDVGTNTTAPKILQEKLNLSLNDAAFATSLYFIFRTFGCLSGSFILRVMKHSTFYFISIVLMAVAMAGLFFGTTETVLYTAIALIGLGNSNVFSIVFSKAILSESEKQNTVSGLMIMGLFGGTIFPLLMGVCSDAFGQKGAVAVMAVGVLYLIAYGLIAGKKTSAA